MSNLKKKTPVVKKSIFLTNQRGVIAQKSYKKGELIFKVIGPIKSQRTKYSLAIGLDRHIEPKKEKSSYNLGHYLNHSCDPTTIVKIVEKGVIAPYIKVIARRDIKEGEEVTFDYATLEYELTLHNSPCKCNTVKCRRVVQGFKDLSHSIIQKYKKEGIIANYLLKTTPRK